MDRKLLVLRPYQIAATEKILQKIAMSYHHKLYGCRAQSGGYIWHTTGSGKTLTSFKVAQLASGFKEIYKVLFVVDRKDLDYQSIKEYDRFQKGAVDSTKNTKVLSQKLHNDESRIIVTTIQKLARFVQQHKDDKSAVFDKHIVIIFDECHRSQFGEMHGLIKKHFKKYYLFGFTGTPIFAQNANGIETTQSV
ncbi:DEAD/DEAH box helicase family protein, partial [uncultured Helicobacter sp.]